MIVSFFEGLKVNVYQMGMYIQLVLLSHYFLHSIIILVFTVFAPTVLSQFRPSSVLGHQPFFKASLILWILGVFLYGLGIWTQACHQLVIQDDDI